MRLLPRFSLPELRPSFATRTVEHGGRLIDIDAPSGWTTARLDAWLDWAEGLHALLVLLLLVMVPIHAGAALKHHFWDKHDTLIGMLPELDDDEPREGGHRPGLPDSGSRPASVRG